MKDCAKKMFVCFLVVCLMMFAGCNSNAVNTSKTNEEAENTTTTTTTTTATTTTLATSTTTTTTEEFDYMRDNIGEYYHVYEIFSKYENFPTEYDRFAMTMKSFDELTTPFTVKADNSSKGSSYRIYL